MHPFDLSKSRQVMPGAPFDAALPIEVAEHIPAELATAFVEYLADVSDLVIFTAAQPGQGGPGHINEQPREYWIDKFAGCGFALDKTATGKVADRLRSSQAFPYLFGNLSIFRRSTGH